MYTSSVLQLSALAFATTTIAIPTPARVVTTATNIIRAVTEEPTPGPHDFIPIFPYAGPPRPTQALPQDSSKISTEKLDFNMGEGAAYRVPDHVPYAVYPTADHVSATTPPASIYHDVLSYFSSAPEPSTTYWAISEYNAYQDLIGTTATANLLLRPSATPRNNRRANWTSFETVTKTTVNIVATQTATQVEYDKHLPLVGYPVGYPHALTNAKNVSIDCHNGHKVYVKLQRPKYFRHYDLWYICSDTLHPAYVGNPNLREEVKNAMNPSANTPLLRYTLHRSQIEKRDNTSNPAATTSDPVIPACDIHYDDKPFTLPPRISHYCWDICPLSLIPTHGLFCKFPNDSDNVTTLFQGPRRTSLTLDERDLIYQRLGGQQLAAFNRGQNQLEIEKCAVRTPDDPMCWNPCPADLIHERGWGDFCKWYRGTVTPFVAAREPDLTTSTRLKYDWLLDEHYTLRDDAFELAVKKQAEDKMHARDLHKASYLPLCEDGDGEKGKTCWSLCPREGESGSESNICKYEGKSATPMKLMSPGKNGIKVPRSTKTTEAPHSRFVPRLPTREPGVEPLLDDGIGYT